MTRHRFIVNNIDEYNSEDLIEIKDSKQVRQIRKVLRLKPNDNVCLIDGKGTLLNCLVSEIGKDTVSVKVTEKILEPKVDEISVSIALAILKGDRFDWAIQKLTEIGVSEIIPIYTQRGIIQPAPDPESSNSFQAQKSKKLSRWLSISSEATEQSERIRSPKIWNPINFEQFLTWNEEDSKRDTSTFICLARADAPLLANLLSNQRNTTASQVIPPKHIQIIIGPEGGFSKSEIDIAFKNKITPCRLSKTILRSETAAIVAATIASSVTEIL